MDPDDNNNNNDGVEENPGQDQGTPADETDFPEVEENPDGGDVGGGEDDPAQGDTAGDDQGDVGDGGADEPTSGGDSTDSPPYDPDVILDDDGNIIQAGNNTSPLIVDIDGPEAGQTISEGNPAVNLLLGLLIVLGASALNAFGLNLTKLDHMKNARLPKSQRRPDYLRPVWIVGMLAYIISQLFGSTLSLRYLRSDWVAPLGSTSLIFNFLFAKWLVGTPVTKEDVRGTALIVVAVILILIFSSINHGLDGSISLERLAILWARPNWLSYFFIITFLTFFVYLITRTLHLILKSRESLSPSLPAFDPDSAGTNLGGRRKADTSNKVVKAFKRVVAMWHVGQMWAVVKGERLLERTPDERLLWLTGVGWAVVGGSLAGACLVFTKAVVKLLQLPGKPFSHPVALVTLFFVAVTAVLQIICLNKGLKAADSTLIVPLFYAGYTVLGFVNSLLFLDQVGAYETWVLIAVFSSIALLVGGVVLLSLKKTDEDIEPSPSRGSTVSATNPSMRLNPIHHSRNQSNSGAVASSSWTGNERPSGTRSRSNSARSANKGEEGYALKGDHQAWAIGDDSDDDTDAGDVSAHALDRNSTSRPRADDERGGLLFDEAEEDEDEARIRVDSKPTGTPPSYESVGKRGFSDDEDEDPFGDFEESKNKAK